MVLRRKEQLMNISNMSNRELEALAQDISVELQERELRVNCEDALNNHLYVDEVSSEYVEPYLAYLADRSADSPLADEILTQYLSDNDIIQSRRTTGA